MKNKKTKKFIPKLNLLGQNMRDYEERTENHDIGLSQIQKKIELGSGFSLISQNTYDGIDKFQFITQEHKSFKEVDRNKPEFPYAQQVYQVGKDYLNGKLTNHRKILLTYPCKGCVLETINRKKEIMTFAENIIKIYGEISPSQLNLISKFNNHLLDYKARDIFDISEKYYFSFDIMTDDGIDIGSLEHGITKDNIINLLNELLYGKSEGVSDSGFIKNLIVFLDKTSNLERFISDKGLLYCKNDPSLNVQLRMKLNFNYKNLIMALYLVDDVQTIIEEVVNYYMSKDDKSSKPLGQYFTKEIGCDWLEKLERELIDDNS